MLTFTEEILLLLLGEEDGAFLPVNSNAFECALAGATLMDLAFALRIDTDLESLIVLNENPTGFPMLDRVLAKIAAHPKVMDAQFWVRLLVCADCHRQEARTFALGRHGMRQHPEIAKTREPAVWSSAFPWSDAPPRRATGGRVLRPRPFAYHSPFFRAHKSHGHLRDQ